MRCRQYLILYLPLVAVGSSAYGPRSGGPIPANAGVALWSLVGASRARSERHLACVRHVLLHRDAALQLLCHCALSTPAPRHHKHNK